MTIQLVSAFFVLFSFSTGLLNSPAPLTVLPAASDDLVTIEINPVGDELKFEQTEITVTAGQKVQLVFKNTSAAMPHNVVVLNSADAIERVGIAAMSAQDYIPDDEAILAYTPLAMPGNSVEVTFTAPSTPGDYPYICTVPGHFYMMKGIMKVTAP